MKKKQSTYSKITGFSLIELMIAMLIGLILLLALTRIFANTSQMNIAQNGLARLQENGRFLMQRIKSDIENVGFQPCASISMESPRYIDQGFAVKPFYTTVQLTNGLPNNADQLIDPQYFLRGHECDIDGNCLPAIDVSPGGNPYGVVPGAGTSAGSRAYLTDVLTMRLLKSRGVLIDDTGFKSTDTIVKLAQDPTAKPLLLESGDQILIGNCYKSLIANATVQPDNKLSITNDSGLNPASVDWASKNSMTQVYNFTKHYETVSYYVGLKTDPSSPNNLVSSLYRVKNNETPTEVAEGVERFDVFYGVRFADGTSAYLTANEVQTGLVSSCVTPPVPPDDLSINPMYNGTGCLWRSVFAIRVHMLLNTIYNSTTDAQETYVYSVDGSTPQIPTTIPSQIDPRKMYRREFVQTISLNSLNL
ncbi:MAG: PilW family protein [Marinicella sp.]